MPPFTGTRDPIPAGSVSESDLDFSPATDQEVADALAALEGTYVQLTSDQTIAGVKTFSSSPIVPNDVYDAATWDNVNTVPTKNAIRDKIEQLLPKTQTRTGAQTATGLTIIDAGATGWATVALQDDAAHDNHILHLVHFGAGAVQAYAIDVSNRTGAASAIVVHNYSVSDAIQLDNTSSGAILTLRNTQNGVLSPGTQGTGDYLYMQGDLGTPGSPNVQTFLRLDKDLIFRASQSTKPVTFQPAAGIGLKIIQANATYAALITHSGGAIGWEMDVAAGAAGFFPMWVNGYDYGPKFSTSIDGGDTLTVQKDATAAGVALKVINKGTGDCLQMRSGSAQVFTVGASGFISVIQGKSVNVLANTATPEGARSAPIGSLFLRTDGGAGTSFYVKESGASTAGWKAVITTGLQQTGIVDADGTLADVTTKFNSLVNKFETIGLLAAA